MRNTMKTLAQLLEATTLYDPKPKPNKTSKELKKIKTPKSSKWGTYNPAPKLFKTAQKLGFRRVQVGQGSAPVKDSEGKEAIENYPTHHMKHPNLAGHHLIVSRKGYVYRSPEGAVGVGPHAGSMLNSLGKHKDFTDAVKEFKKQRDAKRVAKASALSAAHSMPTE
jgi:hypothetical protein